MSNNNKRDWYDDEVDKKEVVRTKKKMIAGIAVFIIFIVIVVFLCNLGLNMLRNPF
ncbi:hypothetical protein I6N90_01685 [Paenibacillus sp. GSMTC-2017]|uniref:hypothetical protein n=1 Tax=Paenibacillus sp. GSMTC-2017 TaxID=2794350 RepID=UPI0018D6D1F4|nr:hypothetical protein [Paenibacillus sp. GSMTC-2017]MBH5316516.1 hypothetical protein [Paenibacillus sp. GSMTC-2017]